MLNPGPSKVSDMEATCDSTILLRDRLVANTTDWSSWVMDLGLEQTSRLMGWMLLYVPCEETSIAQIPSVEKAIKGYCPNCP